MTITLYHYVSGEVLGSELAQDPEESALALWEMAQRIDLSELRDFIEDEGRLRSADQARKLAALASELLACLERQKGET